MHGTSADEKKINTNITAKFSGYYFRCRCHFLYDGVARCGPHHPRPLATPLIKRLLNDYGVILCR